MMCRRGSDGPASAWMTARWAGNSLAACSRRRSATCIHAGVDSSFRWHEGKSGFPRPRHSGESRNPVLYIIHSRTAGITTGTITEPAILKNLLSLHLPASLPRRLVPDLPATCIHAGMDSSLRWDDGKSGFPRPRHSGESRNPVLYIIHSRTAGITTGTITEPAILKNLLSLSSAACSRRCSAICIHAGVHLCGRGFQPALA